MTNEEAIKHIQDIISENNSIKPNMAVFELEKEALYMAIEALKNRKTGKWIVKPNEYGRAFCSVCDYELHINNTKYCPNCGAKMEVDECGR